MNPEGGGGAEGVGWERPKILRGLVVVVVQSNINFTRRSFCFFGGYYGEEKEKETT